MESGEKALNDKLSALSVGKDFIPDIDVFVDDSGSKRRKGEMHLEADCGREQERGIDLRGAMSAVESYSEEVEGDSTADRNTPSCSYSMLKERQEEEADLCTEPSDGPPDGFLFILPYADLKSLLTLERVSKPMRSGVNDVPLWRKLSVEPPLSKALTDDILMTLVKRADGKLKSLRLVKCLRITDAGLANVLSLCPQLEKLEIPGCSGLSADALVGTVEQHCTISRSKGMPGIKQLRVRGIFSISHQHLNALGDMVLSGNGHQSTPTRPIYRNADPLSVVDDERAIDVEICPRCKGEWATLVFDCTRKSCQKVARLDPSKACRGCMVCLPRCVRCGTCLLKDEEFEKTCCIDFVCLSCWSQLPKCSQCNGAICRRHMGKFLEGNSCNPVICEDCLYDYDEGIDLEIFDDAASV
ncbi:hypothetical protein Mapa_013974 [Marchantia paleacea]|nr:hypothetical protein Mapa_013974 [Marchantia paleacea]